MDLFGKKAQAENVELKKKVAELENEKYDLQTQSTDYAERLLECKRENREHRDKIAKLNASLSKHEVREWRVKELEDILARKEVEYKTTIDKLNKLLEEKNIEHTELYSKYKELENMNNCNLEAAQTLKEDLETEKNSCEWYSDKLTHRTAQLEKKEKELEIYKKNNKKLDTLWKLSEKKEKEAKEQLEDYSNTIRLQCDRIDAINTEKADLELQIKSLVASNKAKQIEIDRLKEDKDGKLYLDREKEEIKKLENIANNTKKGRIKSKNLKKSIDIRKNAIDRVQE